MNTDFSIIIMCYFNQILEIFYTTFTFCNIRIFRVRRIMAFISISFQHNCLWKSIRCKIYFFNIICCCKIWIWRHTCKIHNDTIIYHIFDVLCTIRIIHNITICQCTIIPINFTVFILIFCDCYLCTRKITNRILFIFRRLFLTIGITHFIVPFRTCQRHHICTVYAHNTFIAFYF